MTEPATKKAGLKQVGLVAALITGAAFALAHTVDVNLADEPGVVMTLPARMGSWEGAEIRYCHQENCRKNFVLEGMLAGATRCTECGSPLFTMSREEYEALPRDTEFIKSRYRVSGSRNDVYVAIVLSGQERNSIHRPQRCLAGQGFTITGSRILSVPLPSGDAIDVMVLDNARNITTPEGPEEMRMYYAYWFVGQGRETPYHLTRMFWLAWDRVFRSTSHRWAYISVSGMSRETREQDDVEIRAFISGLHEEIVL